MDIEDKIKSIEDDLREIDILCRRVPDPFVPNTFWTDPAPVEPPEKVTYYDSRKTKPHLTLIRGGRYGERSS